VTEPLITLTNPRSAAAEAYRTLRANLMFSNLDSGLHTFAITSPTEDEGKSISLANLAVTLAQSEHSTLVIDADFRRPAQHTLWKLDNKYGLTDMLLHPDAFNAPPWQETSVPGLRVLTTGALPPNPADVLASRRMDEVIERLGQEAEYLLFDVPPVLAVSDAAVLGRKLDGVLLVVKAGNSRREAISRAQEALTRVGVNLLGAVLTNAPRSSHKVYGQK
jgi:capsular exopolysaccharide synthesis family protein